MKTLSLPAKADHFLPHAFPMVFIDRLLEVDGERGMCELQLTSAHIFVDAQGRMDRTCFVELAAQSFAAVEGWKLACQGAPFSSGFLVGVQAFECLDDAQIGDLLLIETIELGGFDGYTVVRAMINRDGETIAQGKIKLYVPAPKLKIREQMYNGPLHTLAFHFILTLSLGFIFSGHASADLRTSMLFSKKLRERATAVESISCEFSQESHLSVFDETIISCGRFLFRKPDKLRWEYLSPTTEGFALEGDQGVRWTETTRTSFSLRSDPLMNVVARQLLAWATFDLAWLSAQYFITLEADSPVLLKLVPKGSDTALVLKYLLIEFSLSSTTVQRVELHEQGGDLTRILFENPQVNTPLDDGMFR